MKYLIKVPNQRAFLIAYGILAYNNCTIEPTIGELSIKVSVDDAERLRVFCFFAEYVEEPYEFQEIEE
jgi:hypothetical protein